MRESRWPRLRTLAQFACVGLALGAAARPASGQETSSDSPASVAPPLPPVDPGLPFSSVRAGAGAARPAVAGRESGPPRPKVEPAGADAVSIQVGDRSRVVQIGERTGPAAARVVALVIAELISDSPDAAQEEGGAAPAVTVARSQNETAAPVLDLVAFVGTRPVSTAAPLCHRRRHQGPGYGGAPRGHSRRGCRASVRPGLGPRRAVRGPRADAEAQRRDLRRGRVSQRRRSVAGRGRLRPAGAAGRSVPARPTASRAPPSTRASCSAARLWPASRCHCPIG